MRGKKLVSLLLVGTLCFGMVFTSEASNVNKAKKEAEEAKKEAEEVKEKAEKAKEESKELKEQKEQAETEKQTLSAQLDALLADITEIEDKIYKKEEEISLKEDELIQARVDENDQYESMKKRIKYMYENGNGQFVEILFEAKDLSDFLNKTEYISSISDYDRDMLLKYKQIVKEVEEQEAALQKEQEEMEAMRQRQQEVKDGVQLTTMHSSKGLEYEQVFILDAAEGITPYKKAVLDEDLEEERRMFYVAMTRAKKELTICYAKKQGSHELAPSRFLQELRGEAAPEGRAGAPAAKAAANRRETGGSRQKTEESLRKAGGNFRNDENRERRNPLAKEMERIHRNRRRGL